MSFFLEGHKKMKKHVSLLFVAPLMIVPFQTILAQSRPDAGALQQQIERGRKPTLPPKAASVKHANPAEMTAPPGVVFTVNSFRFLGNTLLSNEQLAQLTAHYAGKTLGYAEIQQATIAVANAYREAGWVVRSYLPQQEISDGIVTIQIIEAIYGGAQLEGTPPSRVKQSQLYDAISAAQAQGSPLNADKIDRALLLLDDLPGISVSGSLLKGKGNNETALALKASDEAGINGEITIDNTGASATGENRAAANLAFNSPFGLGDLATADLIYSQGSQYGRMSYAVPVSHDGWRVGANSSYLKYNLVTGNFKLLDARGTSSSLGLDAHYPLVRSRKKNLFLGVHYLKRRFNNEANHTVTARYAIDEFSLGLNANLFDRLGGGGANAAGLVLTQGKVDLGRLDLSENTTIQGAFTKLNYNLSRQQALSENLALFASLYGQVANKNLDSAEKFYLGGAYGVRAFATSEGGGADGYLASLELRWNLVRNFTITGFFDCGRVNNKRDNLANTTQDAYKLRGAGLAINWQPTTSFNVSATWAHPISNNQNSSLDKNRWWLTASLPF